MAAAATIPVTFPPRRRLQASSLSFPIPASWLSTQGLNADRHAASLRPFRNDEFGTGVAAPSEGHIQAANRLLGALRSGLLKITANFGSTVRASIKNGHTRDLQTMLTAKERAHNWVQGVEKIWDFYFELFGQRQSQYGEWLVGCDRIALDCYQHVFLGLGQAKSVPAPPAFSYMRTGFSPATFRRGIPLQRLGRQLNPFPLIQLPFHRMVNPWTLGAVLHEVSHNLQNDLGLQDLIPRQIGKELLDDGLVQRDAMTWVRTNREIFADMLGLLLGGPEVVGSLFDVIARSDRSTTTFLPNAVHPTPYLRAYLNLELLRRMGFARETENYTKLWRAMYPKAAAIPNGFRSSAQRAIPLVVDLVCYRKYETLGKKSLSEVVRFGPNEQAMTEEAAQRLAAGNDPGVVPARFLIGAARIALTRRLARPGAITRNFYRELARR